MGDMPLVLSGNGICSKWGNGDGTALDGWWWDTYDEPPTVNTDDLLFALVSAYLVPAIREAGHEVELVRIETTHNPVRARLIDGVEVDHYRDRDYFEPNVWVEVSREQVEEIVRRVVLVEAPTGSTVQEHDQQNGREKQLAEADPLAFAQAVLADIDFARTHHPGATLVHYELIEVALRAMITAQTGEESGGMSC